MIEEDAQPKCPSGIPAWVMTFADLMSLLLAFFVLLFSFSSMEKNIYKEIAGSMKDAFGVQRDIQVREPPKGINIIAREFSPGKVQPTPVDEVRQSTTDDFRTRPVFSDSIIKGQEGEQEKRTAADGKKIRAALEDEINKDLIELEIDDKRIILRIREKASFSSGSEILIWQFAAIAKKLGPVFKDFSGEIIVSGHTDNYPIHTTRFRSNWELSSSRAVSVIHALKNDSLLKDKNYQVAAYAETHPVDTNDTAQGRAKNRRVEIKFDYTDLPDDKNLPDASIDNVDNPAINSETILDKSMPETSTPDMNSSFQSNMNPVPGN